MRRETEMQWSTSLSSKLAIRFIIKPKIIINLVYSMIFVRSSKITCSCQCIFRGFCLVAHIGSVRLYFFRRRLWNCFSSPEEQDYNGSFNTCRFLMMHPEYWVLQRHHYLPWCITPGSDQASCFIFCLLDHKFHLHKNMLNIKLSVFFS